MFGIDVTALNIILKRKKILSDNENRTLTNFLDSLSLLAECYNGSCVDLTYSTIIEQRKKINKISSLLNSYTVVLDSVKNSYIKQEVAFSQDMDQRIRKIK